MATTTTVEITMPQMGESVTEGTVIEWHKDCLLYTSPSPRDRS